MITERQKEALYALIDQARTDTMSVRDLAHRLKLKSHSSAFKLVGGLKSRGLYSTAGKRPEFHASAFKQFKFDDAAKELVPMKLI